MHALSDIPAQALIDAIWILDGLPGYIRAMLAASLLAAFLRLFEIRITRKEVLYGQSYRKTALVVLLLIPLAVWLVPSSRMVVFVEELPGTGPASRWIWRVCVLIWMAGSAAALMRLALARRRASRVELAPVEDEKLLARLAHWQRRLGMRRSLVLLQFPGTAPRLLGRRRAIGIPAAAAHWPGSALDIVMIQALCHLKQHHRRWHLLAQIVACIYWPVTWVQSLHRRLLADFQRAADELTESCYQDRLGYDRALRQLQQRVAVATERARPADQPAPTGVRKLTAAITRWVTGMHNLLDPDAEPAWNVDSLVVEREDEAPLIWTDPYDKVVLFVGQAVFLAFLLTGVTLKERPPETEQGYAMPFALLWKEHFHRNQELIERTQRAP